MKYIILTSLAIFLALLAPIKQTALTPDGIDIGLEPLLEPLTADFATFEYKSLLYSETAVQPPQNGSDGKFEWLRQSGIAESEWYAVDFIMTKESNWRPDAINSIGCIGIGQNCPDSTGYYWLKDACPDWQTNPVCQLQRFTVYAGRYGGWWGAYNAWQVQNWW